MNVCVCVFAKAPIAGEVKTRLAATIGAANAASLARTFLQDTWTQVCRLPWARPVLATNAPPDESWQPRPQGEWWLQAGPDPGARLEQTLRSAIAASGAGLVVAGDTPGIPGRLLEAAAASLDRCDAVLGPSGDGGFYLIGARRCPEGLVAGLPWSRPDTFALMRRRLADHGLSHSVVAPWDDVDEEADLVALERRLAAGTLEAPETERVLREVRARQQETA